VSATPRHLYSFPTRRSSDLYFMTIPEATQLVLQAAALGQNGATFILNMGEPVKIDDLARDLIRLSGFEPDVDIPIVYTGMRPGRSEEHTSELQSRENLVCRL